MDELCKGRLRVSELGQRSKSTGTGGGQTDQESDSVPWMGPGEKRMLALPPAPSTYQTKPVDLGGRAILVKAIKSIRGQPENREYARF